MEPNLQPPTAADHLHRLLTLEDEVLDACELVPEDVPEGADPFEHVARLRELAVEEQDHVAAHRLAAALDFGEILRAARGVEPSELDRLASLAAQAEEKAQRVHARPLEVVRG